MDLIVLSGGVLLLIAIVLYMFQRIHSRSLPIASTPKSTAKLRKVLETQEKKKFTSKEVSLHNKSNDCWLIIDGKVFDVTSYVDEHPGGEAILKNAGHDSSKGFHGDQHPAKVKDLLWEFYKGDLNDKED